MWGKVLGALFGLALLRIPGLFIGFLLGHWFDMSVKKQFERSGGFSGLFRHKQQDQSLFMYTSFAVMGHIAKARGVITSDHIQQANHFMQELGLTPTQKKEAQSAFTEGKAADFPFESQLQEFYQSYQNRKDILQLFLEIQISTACLNDQMKPEQKQLLVKVAESLNFSRYQLEQLLASYQAQSRFTHSRNRNGKLSADALADAYSVLGVAATVTDTELKKNYKRMMAQHHPDKLMAQGMPKEMSEVAKKRTQEIQAAYSLIKKHRGR